MGLRNRFYALCTITCLVTLLMWYNGSGWEETKSDGLDSKEYLDRQPQIINSNDQINVDSTTFAPITSISELCSNAKCSGSTEILGETTVVSRTEMDQQGGTLSDQRSKTLVLMWSSYYAANSSQILSLLLSGRKWYPDCCKADDLIVTTDRTLLPNATVVVFYNFPGSLNISDLPPTRNPRQLWVVFSKESPQNSVPLDHYPNMINWTMSYRLDSDIWSPYGFTMKRGTPIPAEDPIIMPGDVPLPKWLAGKTNKIVTLISHCYTHSRRRPLIAALKNASLPVDVYGKCGNQTICSRHSASCDLGKVWRGLGAKYKFFFAAENSLCLDYITEKFWQPLEYGMVPVVYGGANYTVVAPPHSFIDVRQFSTPKEIADHLNALADDDVEYSKYFEWRRNYEVLTTDAWHGWCKLCSLARQYNNKPSEMDVSPNKSYADFRVWWMKTERNVSIACTKPLFNV